MNISELIKELQKIKREHGDLKVYGGDVDENCSWEVTGAVRIKEWGDEWVQVSSHVGPYCSECHRGCD